MEAGSLRGSPDVEARPRRLGLRIGLIVGAWGFAGLFLGAQAWISRSTRGEPVPWGQAFAIWGAWAAVGMLLTPLALGLVSRFPLERPRWVRSLLAHLAAGALVTATHLALFAVLAPGLGSPSAAPTWWETYRRLLGTAFLMNVPAYWIVVGAAQAWRWAAVAGERERRALRLEGQLAETRLAVLSSQLQPHFLFNALNTIAVLMREDVEAAERVLVRLGSLLRRALDTANPGEVSLREELVLLDAYLGVERARYGDRLAALVDVPDELLEARIPALVLQPLVENAVRHGLANRRTGALEVRAERRGDRLQVTVRDDGDGFDASFRDGVGLSNTRARLELLYGSSQAVEIESSPGAGSAVSLTIPYRGAPAAEVVAPDRRWRP